MDELLKRFTGPEQDEEAFWSDLEAENEVNLEAITKEVSALKKKVSKVSSIESEDDEGAEEEDCMDEDGSFDDAEEEEDYDEGDEDESEDGNDSVDGDEDDLDMEDIEGFDDLDPKEQLRLLMRPVKDEPGFSDDDEEGEGEEEEEEGDDYELDDEEEGDDVEDKPRSKKVKFDILDANGDSDDDQGQEDRPQSAYQKAQSRLRRTISSLESENIGEKDWTLRGEVTAGVRPTDSLLQEDLEFEHVAKLAPTITADVTESLEDLIRKRIKDRAWDDVERIPDEIRDEAMKNRAKKQIELDDTKSKASLAEQYEADFNAAQERKKTTKPADLKDDGPVDEATKAQHDEIRKLFGKLCQSIDALSQNKFAPRAYELAEVEIKTLKK